MGSGVGQRSRGGLRGGGGNGGSGKSTDGPMQATMSNSSERFMGAGDVRWRVVQRQSH